MSFDHPGRFLQLEFSPGPVSSALGWGRGGGPQQGGKGRMQMTWAATGFSVQPASSPHPRLLPRPSHMWKTQGVDAALDENFLQRGCLGAPKWEQQKERGTWGEERGGSLGGGGDRRSSLSRVSPDGGLSYSSWNLC